MKLPVENYEFPQDWKVSPVSDVADFSRGVSWRKIEEAPEGNGLQVISIPNIKDGWIDYESKFNHYLSKEVTPAKCLNVGDIVFVGSSGSVHNVGRNARVRSLPNGRVAFASFTFKAAPKPEAIDGEFFYYLVNSDMVPFPSFCKRAADGKFNFQLRDFARRLTIPLPPLPVQKKIAYILSMVQRAIEAQERIIQTTTELKKALMHKLFTEGLRSQPQKKTEIGPVPESWEIKAVGDVTAVKGGKRLSKGDKLVERDTGFPYIRVTDFNEFSVDVRGLLFLTEEAQRPISRYIINRDDVFISIAGSIGITGMIPQELDGANLTENAARLIANDPSQLHPRFLMYWLASHHCQAEIKAQTVKNAQPKLALARIKSLKVPLPSHDEQVEIARALDLAGCKSENARAKRGQLQDLFRTLLHELMTARILVQNSELSNQASL